MNKKPKPIKLYTPAKDVVPYKNRWGHWVFRLKSDRSDMNWPGLKADGYHPVLRDGKWEWEEDTPLLNYKADK